MSAELWQLVYGDTDPDDSSLADLYDVALMRTPEQLRRYIAARFRIGSHPLPVHYGAWFSAPWQRIYTLNVDDLERAVERQFALPRRLQSISAFAETPEDPAGALEVIHLNGMATEDGGDLTFSTMQYAARLCAHDRHYDRLVSDLETAPFVFVGTTLDEVVLWQHMELHRRENRRLPALRGSFLVSPSLSRARRELLASLGITWIRGTSAELAPATFVPAR